jgi:hypothetical protein
VNESLAARDTEWGSGGATSPGTVSEENSGDGDVEAILFILISAHRSRSSV